MALPGRRHGRQELAIRWDAPAAVVSNGERFDALVAASDVLIVALPRKRLVPFVADPDDLFYRDVPHSAALSLLIGHAAMLTSDVGPLDAACAVHASAILRDLFVLALGPTRDGAEAAAPGLRAARLARIKSDIRAHRTNPELSLQWLSRRHSLPPRQIQTLFYMAGEGYAEFLRHARLDHARDLLTDPANAMRTVAEIAFLSGFGDLSWFNTCFRRRFGMTPTEVRATGLAGEP